MARLKSARKRMCAYFECMNFEDCSSGKRNSKDDSLENCRQ